MALAANEKKTIGVIGAGSWGTALAITLSNKGHEVRITDLDQEMLADMAEMPSICPVRSSGTT